MPPEGYTSITISDETTDKLTEIMVDQQLESLAEAIDYAADAARDPETLSKPELAHLLYQKLDD